MVEYKVWECQICNWVYDEEKGDAEEGLAPGTRWEDIPDDWCCPECGVGKDDFDMVQVKSVSSEASQPAQENESVSVDVNEDCQPEDRSTNHQNTEAPIIIIGTGLAGYNLVKEIRRLDKEREIVLYTADDGAMYSKPNLSVGVSANKSAADLVMDSAEGMAQKLNVEINIFTKVSGIDTQNKVIALEKGGTREYDKLVLATGANCIQPPLKGNAVSKVHKVNDLLDYARFHTLIKPESHVLVLGAGLIGSEYADDLTRAGHKVSVVDPLEGLLSTLLPKEASKVLTDNLVAKGIEFYAGNVVDSIEHSSQGVTASLSGGQQVQADLVLSAVGVRPNISLAQGAGIRCNRGICTGRDLQTSAPDVYAVGDCAEVEGHVLVYIAPLNAQVKALAKSFGGEPTQVSYGVMPVMVKTKLHPVTVNPPVSKEGKWLVDVNSASGVKARFVNDADELLGYALTGDQCRDNARLMRECPKLLE